VGVAALVEDLGGVAEDDLGGTGVLDAFVGAAEDGLIEELEPPVEAPMARILAAACSATTMM